MLAGLCPELNHRAVVVAPRFAEFTDALQVIAVAEVSDEAIQTVRWSAAASRAPSATLNGFIEADLSLRSEVRVRVCVA